jgi:hypothetical protein
MFEWANWGYLGRVRIGVALLVSLEPYTLPVGLLSLASRMRTATIGQLGMVVSAYEADMVATVNTEAASLGKVMSMMNTTNNVAAS